MSVQFSQVHHKWLFGVNVMLSSVRFQGNNVPSPVLAMDADPALLDASTFEAALMVHGLCCENN